MSNSAMNSSPLLPLSLTLLVLCSCSSWVSSNFAKPHENFLQCLSHYSQDASSISNVLYTPFNSSYSDVLNFTLRNLRFSTPHTPKPLLIITPLHVSHIQAAVLCSKSHGLQIRTRSGGHDIEGLSYVASLPFIIVDLINLNSISIDVESKTAWVQSGATLGELYYRIAEKSRSLAFPAGICPTVGVGGHLSGGGYGLLLRKYGLAADNVIDAQLVDANGKFFDRKLMGEDLFWAIRGGGGGSFGIVVAWKVNLVSVPATVTLCVVNKTVEDGATKLIHQWQYVAHKLENNLFLGILLEGGNFTRQGSKINPLALFFSFYLGKADELLTILNTTFPELDLSKKDCIETSWVETALIMGTGLQPGSKLEDLLSKTPLMTVSTKVKSDYVKEPIPMAAIEGIRQRLRSGDIETPQIIFIPYGGKMSEISELETPFSHRGEYSYKIGYTTSWVERGIDAENKHLNWIRELYSYMAPFVSKSPRAAYLNYRDLDIGSNNKYGRTSYEQAGIWGYKYFGKENFDRLVHVKTKVDPYDFFRHEQSIPTFSSK
ncbi:berberine bridge enzyme-like 18 [Cucurbita moschata]|uniref:Berberine bridge enzyme-like 18 n=1 Tax=Cucurbita moschata TaxID=3662 RepID=A0A6J1GRE5_CUCMO|nr:berberine bridge enzyme-like 18 [Cucurbita moschata]